MRFGSDGTDGEGQIAHELGEKREIDSCQFSSILFINKCLTFFEGGRVKTFETLRDRMAICQTRRGDGSGTRHPAFESIRH
jgi:hypothetical protein